MAGKRTDRTTGRGVRDDRPKRRRNKPAKSQVPVKFWFAVGVVASVLTFFFSGTSNTAELDIVQGEGILPAQQKEPVFDFYTILPESEVVVTGVSTPPVPVKPVVVKKPQPKPVAPVVDVRPKPVVVKEAVTVTAPVKPTVTPGKSTPYLLQAGAFRTTEDADKMRSKLLLNGFDPYVSSVTVRENEEWHRVQLGPFPDRERAEQVRAELAELKIDSMLKLHK